jgi:hypothetical protein
LARLNQNFPDVIDGLKMNDSNPGYYRYWGKAANDGNYNLLPYHYFYNAAAAN